MNCLDDSLKHEFMTLRHSADNYHTEHEVNIHTDAFERSRYLQGSSNSLQVQYHQSLTKDLEN